MSLSMTAMLTGRGISTSRIALVASGILAYRMFTRTLEAAWIETMVFMPEMAREDCIATRRGSRGWRGRSEMIFKLLRNHLYVET